MIQEGTAFIKLEDIQSDDSDWLEKVRENSFLKFFPQLESSLLQAGEISQYPRGAKICLANSKVSFLSVPLNGKLILKLSAGKIADERLLSGVDVFETLGFREVIEGKPFPFSVETEAQSTFIFSIQRVDLIRIFQKQEDIDFMAKISSSKSVYNFCSWLIEQDVPIESIRQIVQSPWEAISFEKFKPLQMKHKALIFIEDGMVQCEANGEEQDFRSSLGHGDWFGGSSFEDRLQSKYRFSILEETSVTAINFEVLQSHLPNKVMKRVINEPRIQSQFLGKLSQVEEFEAPGEPLATSLQKLGYPMDDSRLHKNEDPSLFASTTLWNLLQFFDFEINERQIQALTFSKSNMNLGACAQIMEDLGFLTQIIRLGRGSKYDPSVPLLHYGFGRPLLILQVGSQSVIYFDPVRGLMKTSREYFIKKNSNYFLKVEEPHSKQALQDQLQVLSAKPEVAGRMLLRHFLNLSKPEIRNIFIFRLFQSLAVIMVPSFLLGLINQVVGFKQFDYMPIYYAGLGIFILFQVIAIFMNNYFSNRVMASFKSTVQPYFYRLFLNQPNNFVTSVKAGFIQSRLQLIDYAMMGVKAHRIEFLQYILTLTLFLVIIGYYSWQASLVLLVFCVIGIGVVGYARKNGGLDELNTAQQRQEVLDYGLDFLNGLDSIKLSRSEKWTRDRYEKIFLQLAKGNAHYGKSMNVFSSIGTLIFQIGSTLALFTVINEILTAGTTPGNAFALSLYLSYCLGPYNGILNIFFNYSMTGLYPVPGQMVKGEAKDRFKSLKVISLRGNVRFERVSFRYSDRHPFVINDVSFQAKEGEVIAIVGRSGSGKTTLARLIARQAEISGGKILYDDIDARLIDPAGLQSQIGFVSQTPTLFSGSIAQNISLSEDTLNVNAIIEAASAANADVFIDKLPAKYNYRLKEGGRGLSGGERQQIAMARILYSRPHILVLDEATANMDPKAERIISDKLMSYHGKQTVFVVVQRISTARRADKIIVMKAGRIVEVGEHNKLLAMNGEYAELYRHQVGEGK
jgi:ATP-binding cassette subfamily B protein